MPLLLASEAFASLVGFGVMIHLARRLGRSGFADFEYASAVAAWWLVVVRGGFDTIAYREAARQPSLIRPITDLLIGLRLASAALGLVVVLILAGISGRDRGPVVAVSGLVLVASAMATDVGLRASGRWGVLAIAQVIRSLGLAIGAGWLVVGPGDGVIAAGSVVGAELIASMVLIGFHGRFHPRFRRRAWLALAVRGSIAGATRFGRVSLYAADLLVLGSLAGPGLGPYAAARRVAFALLAMGLVVPTAIAPKIARAWASSASEARDLIGRTQAALMVVALPSTVGLMMTADRWMPRIFGDAYSEGGPWLAVIAARLPFVLISNVQQAALIACRREVGALRLMASMVILAMILIPAMADSFGPLGVGLAVLIVEAVGVVAGREMLRGLGLAPTWHPAIGPTIVGCCGVAGVCWLGQTSPLGLVVGTSILAYLALFLGVHAVDRRVLS